MYWYCVVGVLIAVKHICIVAGRLSEFQRNHSNSVILSLWVGSQTCKPRLFDWCYTQSLSYVSTSNMFIWAAAVITRWLMLPVTHNFANSIVFHTNYILHLAEVRGCQCARTRSWPVTAFWIVRKCFIITWMWGWALVSCISLGVSCLGATCSLYTRQKEIRLDQIIEREQDAMFKHCLLQVSGKSQKKKRGR